MLVINDNGFSWAFTSIRSIDPVNATPAYVAGNPPSAPNFSSKNLGSNVKFIRFKIEKPKRSSLNFICWCCNSMGNQALCSPLGFAEQQTALCKRVKCVLRDVSHVRAYLEMRGPAKKLQLPATRIRQKEHLMYRAPLVKLHVGQLKHPMDKCFLKTAKPASTLPSLRRRCTNHL